MGLFDTIECDYPLPNPRHRDLEFQTKDLDCLMHRYSIARDGRLLKHARVPCSFLPGDGRPV